MSTEMVCLDHAHSPEQTSLLHAHRVRNTPSKLPAFRFADTQRRNSLPVPSNIRRNSASCYRTTTTQTTTQGGNNPSPPSSSRTVSGYSNASTTIVHPLPAVDSGPGTSSLSLMTGGPGSAHRAETCNTGTLGPHTASSPHILQENRRPRAKRAPASYSSNGFETKSGPPPAMSSLKSLKLMLAQRPPEQSTSEWAQQQQQLLAQGYINNNQVTKPEKGQLSNKALSGATQPTRNVTSSSRRSSIGMESRGSYYESAEDEEMEDDRDETLRALQGYPTPQRPIAASRMKSEGDRNEETPEKRMSLSGTGDLFLDLALEDMELQNSADKNAKRNSATDRISRIALPTNRHSLPSTAPSRSATSATNRSFDRDAVLSPNARGTHEQMEVASSQFAYDETTAHSRATSIPQTQADINSSKYPPSAIRWSSTTPRVPNYRDASFESTSSATARRYSVPSVAGSARTNAYKQSNLSSFSTPRMYNFSSPSILRSAELGSDNGTISTTAPSIVWDELDDLKSRIENLELAGRLPPTTGQTMRPSGERPPTATTTATTMSTSPRLGRQLKRGRQVSGTESEDQGEYNHEGKHRRLGLLLHAALTESKTVLNMELYKALENAAENALAVASMVRSDGRQGFSSGQSVVGGGGGGSFADPQLRRKADSTCRSLTKLCLALMDSEQSQIASERERSDTSAGTHNRVKSQTLIRLEARRESQLQARRNSLLEARRNSLLRDIHTPQSSPRFDPPGTSLSGTTLQPSPSALAGRRTSLLLGRGRGEREGLEDFGMEDAQDFRGPSRANTEIGLSDVVAGRRTSLLLSRGRGGAGEPEDFGMEDAQDFRGPSRANTEMGISRGEKRVERMWPNTRERTPAYSPLMTDRDREREQERIERERQRERPVSVMSDLLSRTYSQSGSPTDSPSVLASRRRYLGRERGIPGRDTSSVIERLALDRGNLSRLQNEEAVGINRSLSAVGGRGEIRVGRLRARSNGLGQMNDGNNAINSKMAVAGAFTQSFGL